MVASAGIRACLGLVVVWLGVTAAALPAATTDLSDEQVLAILAAEQPRDRAIRRALTWLRSQQRADGRLVSGKNAAALTALGIMAHLAAGVTPEDREHGPFMRDGLALVLAHQEPNGYFGKQDSSRMYGHGIITLMLAEALGMCGDPALEERIREALERAILVTQHAARIKKSAEHAGGWRYEPSSKDSDLSLSGWQLMSLHACQQVGMSVDAEVVRQACDYAARLTADDGRVGYQKRGDDKPSLRGLAMLSFAIVGREQEDVVSRIASRIEEHPVAWKGPWLFYRLYYESVGMSRARPERWASYKAIPERVLVDHQHEEGWWPSPPGDNESGHGRVYSTSMAVLALAVERHVLPAYQR